MGITGGVMKGWIESPRLCWGALALCWLDLFRSLEYTWRFDPQYYYGYLIPLAGGFLFWRAWNVMPRRETILPSCRTEAWFWGLAAVAWLVLTALLEVYVYGRFFLWSKALLLVGVTAFLIWRQGGLAALRSMAMLFVFLLLAVPWPTRMEGPLVGGLAFVITTVTVDLLNVVGYTALQQGRLIEFGGAAPLGVEEACSGIRSLQLSLAFSVYFGELQRMAMQRRLVLIVGGFVLAFIGNLIRTLGLSYVVIEHGMENFDFWHEMLGGTVIAIVLSGLWGLGAWLSRGTKEFATISAPENSLKLLQADQLRFVGMAAGVLASFLLVQAWFLLHEINHPESIQVEMHWEKHAPEVEYSDLPATAEEMLGFAQAIQATWRGPNNRRWLGAFVNWDNQVAAMASELHRPDVCLRAAGHDLLAYHDAIHYQNGKLELEIKSYSFRSIQGEQFYVFYAFWLDGREDWVVKMGSWREYARYALHGMRFKGAKMIQIYAPSGLTERQAKTRVVEILDTGLQVMQ